MTSFSPVFAFFFLSGPELVAAAAAAVATSSWKYKFSAFKV